MWRYNTQVITCILLSVYGLLTYWHPDVFNTTSEGGNKKGATRVLTLKDGGTITEELKKYDEAKMSYAYKITEISTAKTITHAGVEEKAPVLPVDNYSASVEVEAKGDTSVVNWTAGYYRAYANNFDKLRANGILECSTAVFRFMRIT